MIRSLICIRRAGQAAALESPWSTSIFGPASSSAGKPEREAQNSVGARGGDFNNSRAQLELVARTSDVANQSIMTRRGTANAIQRVNTGPISRGKHYNCALVQVLQAVEVQNLIGAWFGCSSDEHDMVIAHLTKGENLQAKRKTQQRQKEPPLPISEAAKQDARESCWNCGVRHPCAGSVASPFHG